MKRLSICAGALFFAGMVSVALAQAPESITTPGTVETRIGTLEFKDGVPSEETVTKLYDNLDFTYAYRAPDSSPSPTRSHYVPHEGHDQQQFRLNQR
jgi:hypothetical protein